MRCSTGRRGRPMRRPASCWCCCSSTWMVATARWSSASTRPWNGVAAPRSKVGPSTATRCVPVPPTGQGQRPTLDLPNVAGPRALGRTPLGVAGAHGAGALVPLLPAKGTPAQEDHRLGAADGHAVASLAAPAPPGAGGGQQLRRAGSAPLLPVPP